MDPHELPDLDPAADTAPEQDADDAAGQGMYRDHAKVLELVTRCISNAAKNAARKERDKADMKNLLFERGGPDHQWVVWDNTQSRFVPRGDNPDTGGLPGYVPRPTTNVYATKIDGIAGLLNQSEPALQFAPGSDDEADRATADVCEDALPVLREECGYDRGDRERLNRLCVMTNAAAYVVYYDDDARYGTEPVDLFRCEACDEDGLHASDIEGAGYTCPGCGAPEDMLGLSVGPNGEAKQGQLSIGRICGDILPSFEFSVPSSARHLDADRLPWVLTHSRMSPEDVARRWPKAKTVARDRGQWASNSGIQNTYASQLQALSSPTATLSSSASTEDGPVVYRLFHDAIDDGDFKFPGGLFAVVINDQVFDARPLPVKDEQGQPKKPLVIRQFAPSPVSAHGKPPADDLVPIQESRNLAEAMIELILMHDAAPTTYLPETVTFIDQPTGAPGATIRYRSLDGQKPTTERGISPPEGLYAYIEKCDEKMDELSKLNAVLAGARPEGDPTLGEIQILQERGMQAFREPIQSLIRFETDLARLLLYIGRDSLWSPRIRRVRGENGQWEVRKFAAADLAGHVDIEVEIASAWPKSPLMQQLKLKDAAGMGVLNPAQDAEIAAKILNMQGLSELKPSLSVDMKQIARELDRWKAATSPQQIAPPNPDLINLALHLEFKTQFLKTEEAETLAQENPPLFQAMAQHVAQLKQAQQAQAMQAAMMQQGAPAPQGGGAPSGDALQAAISQGILQPAGAQAAPADPMAEALAAGVLTPAGAVPPAPEAPAVSIDDLIERQLMMPVIPESPEDTL